MAWRPPQLPPVQKMPAKRPSSPPGYGLRAVVGVAGVALLLSAVVGVYRALGSRTGASPIMPLAALLPAIVMLRYAATGKIKVQ
jgi:hypothetical protein